LEKNKKNEKKVMISLDNVHKEYPNGVHALKGITVEIAEGEFVYVIGPSGAGKSSFIKLMYREEKASRGVVRVNGKDLVKMKNSNIPILRRNIGCVFQDFKLLPKLTVFENIAFVLEVIGVPKKEIEERVVKVLAKMKLSDKKNNYPLELSGGQQQRVAIARAIVNNPKILIADEPTGNLDPETGSEIFQELMKINEEGTTVIMTTHNRELVNSYKNRVIAIEDGKIVSDEVKGEYLYE
jgi:cell division transport system ATP-binding protein